MKKFYIVLDQSEEEGMPFTTAISEREIPFSKRDNIDQELGEFEVHFVFLKENGSK